MGSTISVRKLSKVYCEPGKKSSFYAIKNIDLDIQADEFVCVVGQSGCGKTSLLHILAGLRSRTSGEILVGGRSVDGPGADRGMVFQDYALLPWKTARANVELGPRMRRAPAAECEAISTKFLNMVGLTGFEDRYPHELSGGMQQRVGIARALANEPPVLLMDEPFAAVDALTRISLQENLEQIWVKQKTTVVFVTHSVEEAIFLADRVVVLAPRPGRVDSIFDINLARPRTWSELEGLPEFADLRAKILERVLQ